MTDDLFKQAQLGIEAEAFLATELGKYLLKKADDDLQAAYELLLEAKPSDTDEIAGLQSQAWRSINFKYWLGEAIQAGHYSIKELQDNE